MYMNLKPNKYKISFDTTTMTSWGFIIAGIFFECPGKVFLSIEK